MNPAIPTQRPVTTRQPPPSTSPRQEVTREPETIEAEVVRPREEDKRTRLPRPTNTREEDSKKSEHDETRKQNKKFSKQKAKKVQSKKQKPDDNEIENLGLKAQKSVGCLRVCETLILEVYQLLGGNLCDCQ